LHILMDNVDVSSLDAIKNFKKMTLVKS
jgi:hypothetical protein